MKKIAGALLACIICLSAVFCIGVGATEIKLGDVNNDSVINIKDATLIQKHICNVENLNGEALVAADVDKNGLINITDATYIMTFVVSLIDEFPSEPKTEPSTEKTSLSTDSEGYYNVVVKP